MNRSCSAGFEHFVGGLVCFLEILPSPFSGRPLYWRSEIAVKLPQRVEQDHTGEACG